jgi:hypothetical protein
MGVVLTFLDGENAFGIVVGYLATHRVTTSKVMVIQVQRLSNSHNLQYELVGLIKTIFRRQITNYSCGHYT